MSVDVGSAKGYLDLDISGFLSGLRTAQSEADSTSKNIATKMGSNLTNAGKSLTSAGTTLTKTVTVPLVGIGAAGLKVATDFEKGMSQVKAISGATGKDFDALKSKAIELGANTAFSAGEVAEAMTEMAKAGWSSEQIIDGMSGVLAAAAASGEGLASVSTIVADTITGFGLAASDSTRIADLLTQAANSGTIGVADLGESFKYIAPVASSMGLSVEDVTTAISAMSMAGIKGSQAGTSLRTMLTRMVKPTDAVADAMGDLGITLTNEDGTFKSLNTIVSEMRGSFGGLTDEQKAYYAATLAGQEGMSGLLSLLNLTEEEYNAISESMNNANGVAENTASIMQDNLQSKVEQLGGALESLAIKLADYVLPYLQRFVDWLTNLIDKFTALDPETQKTILKFAGIAAAIGPVILGLGKLVSSVGSIFTAFGKMPGMATKVTTGFSKIKDYASKTAYEFKAARMGFTNLGTSSSKLGTALGSITGPMIAVIAVIALLTAAFVSLWKNNEDFRNKIIEIWNQIKETFEKLTSGIVERLNSLGFDFENIGEVLKAVWEGFCNFLAPIFEGVFQYIADTFETITNVILGIVDFFIAVFKGDWEGAWNAVKNIFESIWNGIKAWFTNILNTIKGVFNVVLGWFGTSWAECWNSIKTFFINIWNGIKTWFTNALNSISAFFKNTWNSISTFFKNIWNSISTFLSNAWTTIKNVVQVGIMFIVELVKAAFQLITLPFRFIWENCKETIISIWNSIKTTVSNALTAVKTKITEVWNSVKSFFTAVWTPISNFIKTTWNSIKTTITTVINTIKSTITSVFNAIKSVITTIWNGIKTTVSNVVNSVKTTITNVFNAVKSTATNVWNSIKSAILTPLNAAKTAISNVVSSIKSTISSGFNSAKNTVSSVFNGIKSSISNVMTSAKTAVQNAINNIKSKFNFSWSLPKLKMPHPKITGSFSLNPPSVPKFTIEWYKKAMSGGMILNGATIFGMDSKGNFLGGGEAGSETIVGTESLMKMIRRAVIEAVSTISDVVYELAKTSTELGYISYNGFAKTAAVVEKLHKATNPEGSGDTYNFYSPKPIDEIEAARQMKKTKRELAEGF